MGPFRKTVLVAVAITAQGKVYMQQLNSGAQPSACLVSHTVESSSSFATWRADVTPFVRRLEQLGRASVAHGSQTPSRRSQKNLRKPCLQTGMQGKISKRPCWLRHITGLRRNLTICGTGMNIQHIHLYTHRLVLIAVLRCCLSQL